MIVLPDFRLMRKSAKWMVLADDRILEYLHENDASIPSEIAEDPRIPWGRQHIGDRCRTLSENGLLRNIGRGVYSITEAGAEYLDGELDAKELSEE